MVANQAKRRTEPTAAAGAPANGAGEDVAHEGTLAVDGPGNNITDENAEAVRNHKELPPAAKPPVKYTKKARDRDEIQLKMLELLSNDPMAGPSLPSDKPSIT